VSFDLALGLNYKRGAGQDFAHSSSTAPTFGIAYLF